jgi:GAF domain-containing protein
MSMAGLCLDPSRAVPPAYACRSTKACAEPRQVQRVEDVNAFAGHIACDSASASEIVVPLIRDGELLGVLDIDSPNKARFTEADEAGCVRLGEILSRVL